MNLSTSLSLPLLLLTFILPACDKNEPEPTEKWLPVKVQIVTAPTEQNGVRYTASVTPKTQVNLSFKVNGYIDAIYQTKDSDGQPKLVSPGEKITRDIQLAHVNDEEYRDQVTSAKASLAAAQASLKKGQQDFKRAKDLYATQSITAPDYDSAQQEYSTAVADVKNAKAQLDIAKQNLAYCTMKPPMNGVILNRNIEIGTLVAPDKIAFVMADMTSVKVIFAVPDVMLKNIALGDSLSVTSQTDLSKLYQGKVTTISPVADNSTRLFDIELTIPNPQDTLKDGMVVALNVPELPVHPSIILSVPITAVVNSKNDPQAYAVYITEKQGKKTFARLKNVKLGDVHGNRVIVDNGIKAGDQVITYGVSTIWDGSLIRIID